MSDASQVADQLANIIFTPGTPSDVLRRAQQSLKQLQKSPQGWRVAQSLLASPNPQFKFLGAQTFIVKFHNPVGLPSLEQQRADLLQCLDGIYKDNTPSFVLRKLLQAISFHYLYTDWPTGLFEVVQVLSESPALSFEFLTNLVDDSELTLPALQTKLIPEVSRLLITLLSRDKFSTPEAVHAFEVWGLAFFEQFKAFIPEIIDVSVVAWRNAAEDLERVARLFNLLNSLLFQHWKSWTPLAKRQLNDSLLLFTATEDDLGLLKNDGYQSNDALIALVRLVIAFCQEQLEEPTELTGFLQKIASLPVPIVDDPLAVEVLEFWNQFTEATISVGLASSPSTERASAIIASVISGYWPRIKLYPELSQSDWEEFSSFRHDFADFVELAYPLMGAQLFDQLTDVVLTSLNREAGSPSEIDWLSVESGLYCLNGLSEIIGDDYVGEKREFQSVQRIFQSDIWTLLPSCENFYVKQTAVRLIGGFVDFFKSNEGRTYLAVTLNYLFSSLDSKSLQNSASRTIQNLCDTCQGELVGEIPAFLCIYSKIRSNLSSVPHVRTVGGIACVVQALNEPEIKAAAIDELLDLILTAKPSESELNPLELQQTCLKCVAMVGKHVRETESPAAHLAMNKAPSSSSFWDSNPASLRSRKRLHDLIQSSLSMNDVSSVEAVCEIVKVGICENTGIFALSDLFVISFIVTKSDAGPSLIIPPILDLARFYVMSRLASIRKERGKPFTPEEITPFINLIRTRHESSPPAALDLLTQIMSIAAHLNVSYIDLAPDTRECVNLALHGLDTEDRFLLRSAVTFWKEFLGSSTGVARSSSCEQSIDLELAESLLSVLLQQIAGGASRSSLGFITDILKVFVSKHQLVASKLLSYMVVEAPTQKRLIALDVQTRINFVAQLNLIKGGYKTASIVQSFWLKCRGIPESYDPHVVVMD